GARCLTASNTSSRSDSSANPSRIRSISITASRSRSRSIHQTLRQQVTAKSRSLRSLAFPRRKSSIFSGSVQVSHSVSVMASPLAQDEVHHPASPDVWPWTSTVSKDVLVRAATFFQSIGQDRQVIEGPLLVYGLSQL